MASLLLLKTDALYLKKENQSSITTINYIDGFIFSYVFVLYSYWNVIKRKTIEPKHKTVE